MELRPKKWQEYLPLLAPGGYTTGGAGEGGGGVRRGVPQRLVRYGILQLVSMSCGLLLTSFAVAGCCSAVGASGK